MCSVVVCKKLLNYRVALLFGESGGVDDHFYTWFYTILPLWAGRVLRRRRLSCFRLQYGSIYLSCWILYPNDKRIINSCCGRKQSLPVACAKRNSWWTLISLTKCAKVIKTYSGVIKFGLNVQNKKSYVALFSVYYIW